MSKFYKNKRSAASAFFRENGFFIVLSASLLVLVCIALLLFYPIAPQEPAGADADADAGSIQTDLPKPSEPDMDADATLSGNPYDPGTNTDTDASDPSSKTDTDTVSDAEDDPPAEDDPETVNFIPPVSGDVDREFSGTAPVFSETMQDWRVHQGVDFFTEAPADVHAAADGIVENVYIGELMGVTVEIRHNDGSLSIYQSLEEAPTVVKGTAVSQGDVIGRTGTTAEAECLDGYHLHFAVLESGVYLDPVQRWS